jgi:hypothetical protein
MDLLEVVPGPATLPRGPPHPRSAAELADWAGATVITREDHVGVRARRRTSQHVHTLKAGTCTPPSRQMTTRRKPCEVHQEVPDQADTEALPRP